MNTFEVLSLLASYSGVTIAFGALIVAIMSDKTKKITVRLAG